MNKNRANMKVQMMRILRPKKKTQVKRKVKNKVPVVVMLKASKMKMMMRLTS